MSDSANLSVLARPAFTNRLENPYNAALYTELSARGVSVSEYSLWRAFRGRYDICHVHWPESTFNASLPEALLTTQSLLRALDWMRARGTRVIWTAHNLRAHERRFERAESRFFNAFAKRVDGVISLSEVALAPLYERFPEFAARPSFVIPHPHYRAEYPDGVTRSQARAQLGLPQDCALVLFFGRILGYKNVPKLIEVVRRLPRLSDGREVVLLIAGKPHDRTTETLIRRAAAAEPRIRARLSHIPQHETQHYFRAANLVALPYRDILNSGSAILALSFDRPVLLPRKGAAIELQRQIAGDWVQLYDDFDERVLELGLLRALGLPSVTDGRHLSALDPGAAAQATLEAYRALGGEQSCPGRTEPQRSSARPLAARRRAAHGLAPRLET
jgi:glycosyltransferase involved in cell wall biosynthesis